MEPVMGNGLDWRESSGWDKGFALPLPLHWLVDINTPYLCFSLLCFPPHSLLPLLSPRSFLYLLFSLSLAPPCLSFFPLSGTSTYMMSTAPS